MGSSNVEASITLEQDFTPQAYALDPRLAEVSNNSCCMHTIGWSTAVLLMKHAHVKHVADCCI
jgi:hypothetical protein